MLTSHPGSEVELDGDVRGVPLDGQPESHDSHTMDIGRASPQCGCGGGE